MNESLFGWDAFQFNNQQQQKKMESNFLHKLIHNRNHGLC